MDSVEETEKETLINSGSEDIVVSEETVKQELQFKAPYGVSEMYVTPRNFGFEVFFYIKYIIIEKLFLY